MRDPVKGLDHHAGRHCTCTAGPAVLPRWLRLSTLIPPADSHAVVNALEVLSKPRLFLQPPRETLAGFHHPQLDAGVLHVHLIGELADGQPAARGIVEDPRHHAHRVNGRHAERETGRRASRSRTERHGPRLDGPTTEQARPLHTCTPTVRLGAAPPLTPSRSPAQVHRKDSLDSLALASPQPRGEEDDRDDGKHPIERREVFTSKGPGKCCPKTAQPRNHLRPKP